MKNRRYIPLVLIVTVIAILLIFLRISAEGPLDKTDFFISDEVRITKSTRSISLFVANPADSGVSLDVRLVLPEEGDKLLAASNNLHPQSGLVEMALVPYTEETLTEESYVGRIDVYISGTGRLLLSSMVDIQCGD